MNLKGSFQIRLSQDIDRVETKYETGKLMKKYYFNAEISDWESWGEVYQSIEIWEPLVNQILYKEDLPVFETENLHPGSNAVFQNGDHVVKIFAPKESGINSNIDYETEVFALTFAMNNGVSVPNLITSGKIKDKYDFSYMIMDYIDGVDFKEYSVDFSNNDKYLFGKRLRNITDLMNKPCESFNDVEVVKDAIHDKSRWYRWEKFSESFKQERIEYIKKHDYSEYIFVHGDLCFDNFIINKSNGIHIIDFADSLLAPICYEHAHLVCELFGFDKSYLNGFFGDYETDTLVNMCIEGILIHDFGGDIVSINIATPEEIDSIEDLRMKLYELLG